MTSDEFVDLIWGVKYATVAELCGRKLSEIQACASGRKPIPEDLAQFARALRAALESVRRSPGPATKPANAAAEAASDFCAWHPGPRHRRRSR